MADLMMKNVFKEEFFSWGASDLSYPNSTRDQYIKAIRKADQGDYYDLIVFAKS